MKKSKRKTSQEALNREALVRIETVLNKVRSFAYDPKLLDEATWLVDWAKDQVGSLSKYRAISLAIEIHNEYGHSNRSKSTIEEFKKDIENEFDIAPNAFENLSENEIDTYKRRLDQVCWVYAGAAITHYWFNENEEGLGWIRKARDIIENYITKPHKGIALDRRGIQARLSYYAALLYLQLNDTESAEEELKSSLELAEQRFAQIEEAHKSETDYWESAEGLRESRYTNICLAKIQGFVKARVHLLRGELRESEFLLKSSEVVLRQSRSPTMSNMIRLWLFKVRRTRVGREPNDLSPIIAELKSCHESFSRRDGGVEPTQQKRFYASAAAFEVGLSSLYKAQGLRHKDLANSDAYQEALRTAISYAEKVGRDLFSKQDGRHKFSEELENYWKFNKALLWSRIERETDGQKAKEHAERALAIAGGTEMAEGERMHRPDLVVDAYIAIGEALLKLNRQAADQRQANEALDKFIKAERINADFNKDLDKMKAVCCLRKAEAYVALNKRHEALRMLDEWKLLKNKIESRVVHYIAEKVELQLGDFFGDFHISKETPDLKIKDHSKRLEEWLTILTLRRHQTEEQQRADPKWLTDEMGISLSKAYQLVKAIEGADWKRKRSSPKVTSSV